MNTAQTAASDPTGTQAHAVRARAPYGMRALISGAERAAATALVQDRALWLTERGITVAQRHIAAYQDGRTEAVGLYENTPDREEVLAGCMLLHRQPAPRPGNTETPGPHISLVHTAPGRPDELGWLITLWACDFAARTGATMVHSEVSSRPAGSGPPHRLLHHLRALGWLITGTGLSRDGERVTRLLMSAQTRNGLAALIHCTVPLDSPTPAPTKNWRPR
ncbi:hypothetical protein [Streptomyces goshikiensis]